MKVGEVLDFLEPPITIGWDLPPETALRFLRDKGLRETFSYADALAEERAAGFTIAKMLDTDLLADVKAGMEDALARGMPFREWADTIMPTLQARGWWGRKAMVDPLTGQTVVAQLGSPSRLETIFRTNMQSAYAVGQWREIKSQAEVAPYLIYDAVDDHRTRPQHAAWDGTVLPVGHKFWRDHYPPNGWNCRCGVIQVSADELDELGLKVTAAPPSGTYAWTNPRTGKVEKLPIGIDPGFDHNIGVERLGDLSKLAVEKAKALPKDAASAALYGLKATERAVKYSARRKMAATVVFVTLVARYIVRFGETPLEAVAVDDALLETLMREALEKGRPIPEEDYDRDLPDGALA